MKAYGHSRLEHGAGRPSQELQDRARATRTDQGQWYDDQHIVEAEQRAALTVGEHLIDMGRPIGRVVRPDGTVVDTHLAKVIRRYNLTVKTSYPVRPVG
ncbi:MAG TPA: hypothetical protein VLS89_04660 [Candidatus Nanopelagicales bacterium]|nr:hypothetical protein [Candidatus Nanopelagicales bacterium]